MVGDERECAFKGCFKFVLDNSQMGRIDKACSGKSHVAPLRFGLSLRVSICLAYTMFLNFDLHGFELFCLSRVISLITNVTGTVDFSVSLTHCLCCVLKLMLQLELVEELQWEVTTRPELSGLQLGAMTASDSSNADSGTARRTRRRLV